MTPAERRAEAAGWKRAMRTLNQSRGSEARLRGRPTADARELDGDVILASQAIEVSATIVTDNVGHLSQFTAARRWKSL